MPTVVIVGSHDFICGPRWATSLLERIPDVRLCLLARSGHFGHVEQPEEFVEAAVQFLDRGLDRFTTVGRRATPGSAARAG